MTVRFIMLLLFSCLLTAGAAAAGGSARLLGKVTYVSSEGVYIDAGRDAGLAIGDTLQIQRAGSIIATVVVSNISSRSAAAVVLEQTEAVKAGDDTYGQVPSPAPASGQKGRRSAEPEPEPEPEPTSRPQRGARLRGDISISNFLHHDLTETDRSWTRPGLATRLTIEDIGSAGLRFELRHRTRLYHRSRTSYDGQDTDEWSHQVYEFGLFHDGGEVSSEWGVGRVLAPYVRGVGFIDGAYFAQSLDDSYKIGFAAGTSPDHEDSGLDFDRRKLGAFVAYETGDYRASRLTLSAAFSTEYEKSTVSRDFLYLQGTFAKYRRLTMYHSVEIDLNRDWRYDRSGDRLTFTNYLGSATLTVHRSTRLFFSYDTRKNIRYYETRETPDSLFDDRTNRGVRGGLNVRLNDRVSVRASGGIRFRDDSFDDPVTGSFSVRLNRFPGPRHSLAMYLTCVKTQFTTGYRPMATYRFPLSGRMLVNLTGAAHIYETGTVTTKNYYGDISTSYYFRNGLFAGGSYRQYFDDDFNSIELFTELGWRW